MPIARLSSRSQIVIPAEIRKRLELRPGDSLEITEEQDRIMIRKAPVSFVDGLDTCASDLWQGYEEEMHKARD